MKSDCLKRNWNLLNLFLCAVIRWDQCPLPTRVISTRTVLGLPLFSVFSLPLPGPSRPVFFFFILPLAQCKAGQGDPTQPPHWSGEVISHQAVFMQCHRMATHGFQRAQNIAGGNVRANIRPWRTTTARVGQTGSTGRALEKWMAFTVNSRQSMGEWVG